MRSECTRWTRARDLTAPRLPIAVSIGSKRVRSGRPPHPCQAACVPPAQSSWCPSARPTRIQMFCLVDRTVRWHRYNHALAMALARSTAGGKHGGCQAAHEAAPCARMLYYQGGQGAAQRTSALPRTCAICPAVLFSMMPCGARGRELLSGVVRHTNTFVRTCVVHTILCRSVL